MTLAIKRFRLVSPWVLAIFAAGCSAKLYKPTVDKFSEGYSAASQVIMSSFDTLNAVHRRAVLEGMFYQDDKIPDRGNPAVETFAEIVCAQSSLLDPQRAGVSTLGEYKKTLDLINTQPKEDIPSIAKSIYTNWGNADALKPHNPASANHGDCSIEVTNLLTLRREDIPQFAFIPPQEVIKAAQAVLDALKEVTTQTLLLTDDVVRGHRLKEYVLQSNDVVQQSLNTLTEQNPEVVQACRKIKESIDAKFSGIPEQQRPAPYPCQPEWVKDVTHSSKTTVTAPPTSLDGVKISQLWAALRRPWHIFLNMQVTLAAWNERHKPAVEKSAAFTADAGGLYYLLDKQQEELNTALNEYRTIRNNPGPGDVARGMKNANDTLVRLAHNDLTPAEAWGVISDFNERVKKVRDALTQTQKASGELITKVKEVYGNGAQ